MLSGCAAVASESRLIELICGWGRSPLHSDAFTWAGKSGSNGFERSRLRRRDRGQRILDRKCALSPFSRILKRGYHCELPER